MYAQGSGVFYEAIPYKLGIPQLQLLIIMLGHGREGTSA